MSIETNVAPLRAPFPYFGGKRRIATRVWEALGDVRHYVEPFCGSAAVLLARPHKPSTETVNDADGMICNFWRAVKAAPAEVAHHADWPVNELDLRARHTRLRELRVGLTARLEADADYFDAKVAGWWVWGACAAIGDAWHQTTTQRPAASIGSDGRGVHALTLSATRRCDGAALIEDGAGFASVSAWLDALAARLRDVRVTCGNWTKVLGDAALIASAHSAHHRVGVYFDPPYSEGNQQYAAGGTGTSLSADVSAWCVEHDSDERLRIVLSGYDGEHNALEARGWSVVAWKTKGGYSSQGGKNANQKRERLWLSPHCLRADHGPLFGGAL